MSVHYNSIFVKATKWCRRSWFHYPLNDCSADKGNFPLLQDKHNTKPCYKALSERINV